MKKIIGFWWALAVIFGFYSCKIENKVPVPKLQLIGLADSSILGFNEETQYLSIPLAHWKIENAKGGAIDSTGKLKAGTTEGVFTIIAVSKQDITDTLRKRVIILKDGSFFNEVKNGGYIFSFRHANAATGSDKFLAQNTLWWQSCDANTARQITLPIGQNQSDSTGRVFKFLKIPVDTTLTSEYCRCIQTAQYFKLGVPNKTLKELTFSVYDEANRHANIIKLFNNLPFTKKNYVVVGHTGFADAPVGSPLASLNWGDCAVYKKAISNTNATYLKTIKVTDWLALAKVLK